MPERYRALQKDYQQLETEFQMLANSIPQLAWMTRPDGWIFWYNQRWFDYTGTTLEAMQGWGWQTVHHPDHVDRVVEHFRNAFETGEPWEDTFPLKGRDGDYRWFLSRAMPIRDADGDIVRWFGTNTDVTEQKKTEERQLLLMREVDHRAKNVLAVAQSVVNLTRADTVEDYKRAVEGRIASLARAHSLLAATRWDGADLEALLRDETAHLVHGDATRIRFSGTPVTLPPAMAQTLALIVHELATNATKYGALSHPAGRLDISWRLDEAGLAFNWRETGSTGIRPPERGGFGTDLIDRIMQEASGSTLNRTWNPDGLSLDILFPCSDRPADAPARAPRRQTPETSRRKVRVLVVEDEPLTAMDLEVRLQDAGYEVLGPAGSVAGAMEIIAGTKPDIALLDGNLSGERSYGLAADLRTSGVPVVFCTGYEELENLPETLRDCRLVSKPFRDEVLLDALSAASATLAGSDAATLRAPVAAS